MTLRVLLLSRRKIEGVNECAVELLPNITPHLNSAISEPSPSSFILSTSRQMSQSLASQLRGWMHDPRRWVLFPAAIAEQFESVILQQIHKQ
jgi:hypothetical protein